MIRRISVKLVTKNKTPRPSSNWGYALYGAMMERLPSEIADALHEREHPILSQYLSVDRDAGFCVWNVTLLGDAPAGILDFLLKNREYPLEKNGAVLEAAGFEVSPEITERELCLKYLAETPPERFAAMRFVTPCSFKSAGEYATLPTKEWILRSCVNRWNAVSKTTKIDDEQAVADIVGHTRITGHNLRSVSYVMKKVGIPSFVGYVILSARGPETLLRLFNLLTAFGGYCGIGIKTALGMGGVEVTLGRQSELRPVVVGLSAADKTT